MNKKKNSKTKQKSNQHQKNINKIIKQNNSSLILLPNNMQISMPISIPTQLETQFLTQSTNLPNTAITTITNNYYQNFLKFVNIKAFFFLF